MTDNVLTVTIAGRAEDIEVSAFLTIVKNTVALLRDIEAQKSRGAPRLRWLVTSLSKSSPAKLRMAGVDEHPRGGGGSGLPVVESFLEGMKLLESGARRPEEFTDIMLERATNIVRPLNSSVARLIFSDDQATDVVPVSQHIAANVDRFRLPDRYSEYGEVEGTLDALHVHKPPYEFFIYDPLTDHKTACHFDPDDFEAIRAHVKERIRVNGLITYRRRDDVPISVLVDDWLPIPRDENLPSIEDLHAAGINITGSRKSEDVIAELRRTHD